MFPIIKPAPRYNFNAIWNQVKRVPWLGKQVNREVDLPLASDLFRAATPSLLTMLKMSLAHWLLGPMAFRGADGGYGGESRRWLYPDTAGVEDWTGTGVENTYNIHDRFTIDLIGMVFSVAGTTTAPVLDFDLLSGPLLTGTRTALLDGTNGRVTAPTTTEAIGSIVYTDLATAPVDVEWGNSVEVDVTTADAAAMGLSFIVGYPIAEHIANAANTVTASA